MSKNQFDQDTFASLEAFQAFLDTYGGDPDKWPEGQRADALTYTQSVAAARAALVEARRLDAVLATRRDDVPPHVVARIMDIPKAAPGPKPPNTPPRWILWPTKGLRPGAILAASMLLGLVVGTLSGFPLDGNETEMSDAQAIQLAFGFMETTETLTTETVQ